MAGPASTHGPSLPGSPSLRGVRSSDGIEWRDFRRTLAPRWAVVWLDITGRYLLLALGYVVACAIAASFGNGVGLALAPLTGAWMGFWFASLVLFMHEAAHFNLHPDKATNDRLANALVCILIGNDVKHYRAHHWEHHLHLGDLQDTEISYHWAPTPRYFLETLLGVHAWRVFKAHRRARPNDERDAAKGRKRNLIALARGFALHAVIVGATLLAGWWSAAVAWVLAVAVVFPFLSALRQQLEHRALDASSSIDYSVVPHGPVNRMFERTLFARAFGAAGFVSHLLHHWDPTVSYTRFADFERFLMRTELAPRVDEARASYLAVWRQLARG
ncbi:MAG TPA: fatty acid desaturase [Candidatus Binatia bacterium]